MSSVGVLSTTTVYAQNHSNDHTIDLTPWDLQFLPFEYNQLGYLYHHPISSNQIHHLKHSLSSALDLFHPLTGRLNITKHHGNIISCSINCNNQGALFVHAVAENISVAHVLESTHLPPVNHSFYALNGFKNYQGTSQPLLGVQVTELVDGVFIGLATNHIVGDGNLFTKFTNSWAKISKGCFKISKLPTFERWFPKGIELPIRFPFMIEPQYNSHNNEEMKLNPPERVFHFTKENMSKLKSKANLEAGTSNISSLQALFTHTWRSFIRSKKLDPETEVDFWLDLGVRHRLNPPLPEDYFGVGVIECVVTMKAGELLEDGGLGKGALKMNKIIASHSDEKIKSQYENWLLTPTFFITPDYVANNNSLVVGGSPWFDMYGNDFGWGKPVGVRSGNESKRTGKIYMYADVEGNLELEVCHPYEILEAMGNDPEFIMCPPNVPSKL